MTTTLRVYLAKLAVIFFSILLILVAAYPAFAKEATSTGASRRDQVKERVTQKRATTQDKIDDLRVRIASKEAALRVRLQTFKDQKKAEVVQRINDSLARINKNKTDNMLKYLDKMTSILNKLENRVNSQTPDIKDSALAKLAIQDARSVIATASAAVQNQSNIDYTIQVSSESGVGKDAKAARDKLHTDLKALRQLVINARQAVGSAIRVAKSGRIQEGTSSGQQ